MGVRKKGLGEGHTGVGWTRCIQKKTLKKEKLETCEELSFRRVNGYIKGHGFGLGMI